MGYHVYLFRKEVKEQNSGFDFLEQEELVLNFTEEQFENLKNRLLRYGYERENESSKSIRFQNKPSGTTALLTRSQLSFSSGLSEDGVFEISMTASEFTDSGEFAKFDPQEGAWEEM